MNNATIITITVISIFIFFSLYFSSSVSAATMNIYTGQNIVGIPNLSDSAFSSCGLVYFHSTTNPGCIYDNNGYFVYYDPLGSGGDCGSKFFSASSMAQGFGYYLYANQSCTITYNAPTTVQVTLYPNKQNIISVPVATSLDDLASVCGDKTKIFTYFKSGTKTGCLYDDNGYFIYYDAGGSATGDCSSRFKSEAGMRPFVGYYIWFNGMNGDGQTACSFKYENGVIKPVTTTTTTTTTSTTTKTSSTTTKTSTTTGATTTTTTSVSTSCDSQCKLQGYASGTCRVNSTNTNLAVIPDEWGGYAQTGKVQYDGGTQIIFLDYNVTHNGHVSVRLEPHTGNDANIARECDGTWYSVKPGDRIVAKCWIKTDDSTAAEDANPYHGGRIGIDLYAPKGDGTITIVDSYPHNGQEHLDSMVRWNTSVWTQKTWDITVPSKTYTNDTAGNTIPSTQITQFVLWMQAMQVNDGTARGDAWFSDCELYINPTNSSGSCQSNETSIGQNACSSGTCCCSSSS